MIVTLLFTDIEGSTRLWEKHPQSMESALKRHDELIVKAVEENDGCVFKNLGDGFCAFFDSAYCAVQASLDLQKALTIENWGETTIKVRTALHAGDPQERDGDYFGPPVNRVARLLSAGHGGQILLSKAVEQLVAGQVNDGVELIDLGKHQLRSLTLPEHIYQLKAPFLEADFPALRTQNARSNLPVQSTPFVGREMELTALELLLKEPETRLITIVGPGGIGKTRLALALAERQLSNYEHGAVFVSLAPLDSAEDIVPALARSLGFSFYEEVDQRQQIIDYLRTKSMLLLLDNFEQLLEAATLAAEIVQAAPDVKMIVTSRELLRLLDEQVFPVQGLDFPDWETAESSVEAVNEYDAVRLFVNSARKIKPEFELGQGDLRPLAKICHLVQGMPLGIVLAASWIPLLSLRDIAGELSQGIDILSTDLRDVPERHRSLQAVLDSTWDLLNRKEREVLKHLSVYRGGSSHKAVQEVTGATLMDLKSLTGKLLINVNQQGRYEIHELLRQYAAEKLKRDPEADFAAHDRHSAYYLDAVAEREEELFGPQMKQVMSDIDDDLENVRSALRWAAENQQLDHLNRAINPLFQYYIWRDLHQETFKDAQIIVESLEGSDLWEFGLVTAKALARQGMFLPDQEDLELVKKGEALLMQADQTSIDFKREKAFILGRLGQHAVFTVPQLGFQLSKESLNLFRDLEDQWGQAAALNNLAIHADITANLEEERRLREEIRSINEKLGNPQGISESHYQLAVLANDRGEVEEAQELARQSYKTLGDVGYPSSIARGSFRLGSIMYWTGLFDDALEMIEAAKEIFEELGNENFAMWCNIWIAWTYSCIGEYELASSLGQHCLSYYESIGDSGFAHNLMACVAVVKNDSQETRCQSQKALEIYRAQHHWFGEMHCLFLSGLAERLEGNQSAFRQKLIEGLQISTRRKQLGFSNGGLSPAALYFADSGQVERAVEIYETACQHPFVANYQLNDDLYGKNIKSKAESLPREVIEAARQRGRERDPWETAKEVLAELEAEEEQEQVHS